MTKHLALLIIDPQIDFHPEGGEGALYHARGSLAVEGANEDSSRIASFIQDHIHCIDDIFVTLDSHHRNHIAHGIFWVNDRGENPPPFTIISHNDVLTGKWKPKNSDYQDHCVFYTKALEARGRFQVIIWPEHCLIGSVGHAVVPELHIALQSWAGATGKTVHYIQKGMNCLTEMYSAIAAEVTLDDTSTQKDYALIQKLLSYDQLVVCGQALSHCVAYTLRDLVEHIPPSNEYSKLVLLENASSPVPGFEKEAENFVLEMRSKGVTVTTTEKLF